MILIPIIIHNLKKSLPASRSGDPLSVFFAKGFYGSVLEGIRQTRRLLPCLLCRQAAFQARRTGIRSGRFIPAPETARQRAGISAVRQGMDSRAPCLHPSGHTARMGSGRSRLRQTFLISIPCTGRSCSHRWGWPSRTKASAMSYIITIIIIYTQKNFTPPSPGIPHSGRTGTFRDPEG